MRICTYNIHGGKDTHGRSSLGQIGTSLEEGAFDVVLLQEVDRRLPRSNFTDQVRALARRLDMHYGFYGRLRFGAAAFGNAILTGAKPQSIRRLPLPSSGGEPRAAIGVTLDDVAIWNTHLGLRQEWRATQLAALADAVGEGPGTVLVGGDFNAPIDSAEVTAFLAATGLEPISCDAPTFPNEILIHRIDFLFGRGLSPTAAGTIAAPGSDHCLVWAEVMPTPQQR